MPGRDARILPAALVVLFALGASAEDSSAGPIATTDHFAFHSDFDTNLHDALLTAAAARRGGKTELISTESEPPCFSKLAPSARKGWDLAVDYYAGIVVPGGWSGKAQVALRYELGSLPGGHGETNREFVAITRGMLAAAAPAYAACAWPAQDALNRKWLADLEPRLKSHEAAVAARLETLYATPFHGLPIRVDIVASAAPFGANSWILDPGGHILVSTTTKGSVSLETVFHEASHTLAAPWRPDPLPKALAAAARTESVEIPRDLWHVVTFFTTGEAVRARLEKEGERGYVPMIESLWHGSWAPLREPVHAVWPAYLKGKASLDAAARALVKAIGEASSATSPTQ